MTKIRKLYPGMGQAVAERTVLRKKQDGKWENWGDVAKRVALGNSLLCSTKEEQEQEFEVLNKHLSKATLLTSGRHLQHGDENQPNRSMEVFCNCSTTNNSFTAFLLLMSGSGVGRSYDDDLMLVNWDNAPILRCVISDTHPDFDPIAHESVRDAKHKYGAGKDILWHVVKDTREGWAKALEIWENAAFEKIHRDKTLILDFSEIRAKGTPIKGMQGRPASGPVPLMHAFYKASSIKSAGLPKWMQAMYIDHYFAECVLVGGARRSARMSTKTWYDKSIIEFITIKRPIEYYSKNIEQIKEMRSKSRFDPFLWTSNNSITVDQTFWNLLKLRKSNENYNSELAKHARHVFKLATEAAYGDGTGEPGFINQDKLVANNNNLDIVNGNGEYIGSNKYKPNEDTLVYLHRLLNRCKKKTNKYIVNPCSEITLATWGGFCTIADVVPYHADTLDEAEEAVRCATRFLIRVNTMDSIYSKEVKRTNRIGVGLTGVHEFAWKFFGYSFKELINPEVSKDFWLTLSRLKRAVRDEAIAYATKLGVVVPHTDTTIKPSGSVSKLFGLTEGWHLPSMAWYLRWVQFSKDDPLVTKYAKAGYPVKELKKYQNAVIVGFPTEPVIASLGLGEKLITAAKATPEEQYQWLMLGEKYWIIGVDENEKPLIDTGNNISYTLKYNPEVVDYRSFRNIILKYQSNIRCCSVMPQEKLSSYEYLPEEPVTKAEYDHIYNSITKSIQEDVDFEHVDCASGACPIDFRKKGDNL